MLGDWLWLRGNGLIGHNFGSSYLLDGRLSLGFAYGPYGLDLGLRHLLVQGANPTPFQATGPMAGATIKF
ncbi:hypothetical protein D3C78_1905190 [compost metagenome]